MKVFFTDEIIVAESATRKQFLSKLLDGVTSNFTDFVVFKLSGHLRACVHSRKRVSVTLKFRSLLLAYFITFKYIC
jgi:hypothetical protein